jgi:hypothetical protein
LTKPGELKAKILEAREVGKESGEGESGLPLAVEVEQWDEDLRS